ncbi:hypothetical protein BC834DRAFT_584373 [Gloeopeniophorella convolvens]|nr:hypothetical protein BC834DRAFT_584373 [Gloeopeniophorella convolvens]
MPPRRSWRGSSRQFASDRDGTPRHSSNLTPRSTDSDQRTSSRSKFEHIASISRSSGVERDGDTQILRLKNVSVQEEYHEFVQHKIDEYWKKYANPPSLETDTQRSEVEGNILLQFRKLREGILSIRRHDQFAVEVFETSLWLSIIFHSQAQTTSILSRLLPDIYLSVTPLSSTSLQLTILLASLHSLDVHYPSQRAFLELSKSLPQSLAFDDERKAWLRDLSRSLRRGGYSHFGRLTQAPTLESLAKIPRAPNSPRSGPDLGLLSLQTLVASLRERLRLSAWRTIRCAYREFALPVSDTATWLSDTLLLEAEREKEGGRPGEDRVQQWFSSREQLGEVGKKEGAEGRWTVQSKK